MLNLILFLGAGVILAVFGVHFITAYREAQGTPWERALASARDSATILWQGVVTAAGMLIVFADNAAAYFALPEVQSFLKDHLTPTRVAMAMTAIAFVTVIARLRTLRVR